MSDGESRCPLCAGEIVADPFGDHQVGCGGNGDRIHRHDSLRGSLFSAAQSAALAPRKASFQGKAAILWTFTSPTGAGDVLLPLT